MFSMFLVILAAASQTSAGSKSQQCLFFLAFSYSGIQLISQLTVHSWPLSALKLCLFLCPRCISPTSASIRPTSQPVSHLTSQPTLITSPPPKGSYFLIAWPSCSGIPEINSPPLCYSYYLGVLELACPSKQTLYSAFFLTPPPPYDLISGHTLQPGTGTCPPAAEVNNGQRYRAVRLTSKTEG